MPPKAHCGNPLFLSWLEELRDQARDKGLKSGETFGKACKSIQACPVTYPRPRDLVCLQYVGPKIVSLLEKKHAEYCKEQGLPPPGSPEKGKSKARPAPQPSDEEEDPEAGEGAVPAPKKRKAPSKPPKAYVPQKASGGYGILLGLVLAIEHPTRNTQVFLTKSELIRAAQPYSDTSYTHSEKGTYFNAWSSMKTLVGRGYVYVTGNPHKYCLTEEGYEVACAIRRLLPEFADIPKHPFLHTPVSDVISAMDPDRRLSTAASSHAGANANVSASAIAGPSRTPHLAPPAQGRFQFWYIDSLGARVTRMVDAMIRLDHTSFTNLRKIEFRASQSGHPFARQLKLVDASPRVRDAGGVETLYGFVGEEEAPPVCSKFDEPPQSTVIVEVAGPETAAEKDNAPWPNSPPAEMTPPAPAPGGTTKSREMIMIDSDSDDDDDGIIDLAVKPSTQGSKAPAKGASKFSTSADSTAASHRALAAEAAMRRAKAGPSGNTSAPTDFSFAPSAPASASAPIASASRPAPRLSSHVPSGADSTDLSAGTSTTPAFKPSDALIFPAGSYEIVLIVDTREVESKTSRDRIEESLLAKGINVETRALRLGDMCWVARRLDGLGGEEDECVLDYVVERKRLDDLCTSIRDGRYNEQCFRLGNSCISHVYYIVEDWQVTERMTYDGLQIMTAKSQIQVHNRFFLQETHKLSESIDFLATMTRAIQDLHRGTALHVIPTRYLSRSSYKSLQTSLVASYPDRKYLTSFAAYQDLNDKNASKTLKEQWARMLLCVKGMSAERVSAVLDVWDTPRGMWEDLKRRREEGNFEDDGRPVQGEGESQSGTKGKKKAKVRGPELFFADRVKGEGRRKIGDALSRDLYKVFTGDTSISN